MKFWVKKQEFVVIHVFKVHSYYFETHGINTYTLYNETLRQIEGNKTTLFSEFMTFTGFMHSCISFNQPELDSNKLTLNS